jgi:hypothetical protein
MKQVQELEVYLKTYGKSYFDVLKNIKTALQKIWKKPRLDWFTDHGIEHSERIIFHLNRLCSGLLHNPESGPKYGLQPVEVFLLLASAWLHDVGMQDLNDLNLSVDMMNMDNAWDEVRKRHPQRSFDIIMEHATGCPESNEFWLGLDREPPIHSPLALICKAHGSDYYNDVIEYLGTNTFNIDGKGNVRCELLASLLLMADELDLHSSRAVFKENYPLSKLSSLHHFRHHYIQSVEVCTGLDGTPETQRTICITFRFPETEEDEGEWCEYLKKWVGDKIEREAENTFPFIHKGFDGHFLWSRPLIKYDIQNAIKYEKKIMDKNIQYLLKANIQKVIDWKDISKNLSQRFKEKNGGVVCIRAGREQGIDLFISFIGNVFCSVINKSDPQNFLSVMNFSFTSKYHSVQDIFGEISTNFGINNLAEDANIVDQFIDDENFYLIVLQSLDVADKKLIQDINDQFIRISKNTAKNILLLITASEESEDISLSSTTTVYNLPDKFETHEIEEYFVEMGNSKESAKEKTENYIKHMKIFPEQSSLECIQIVELINEMKKRTG